MSETTTPPMHPAFPPSKEAALALMRLSMPSFEDFVEHSTTLTLKAECEKAGELTPERAALFDAYKAALMNARTEYEDSIATLICERMTEEEIKLLTAFFNSPTHKAMEKSLMLSADVNNLGTLWSTKVLERDAFETWKMMMESAGTWQLKNLPPGSDVILADAPPNADGWKHVTPKTATEYVPSAPAEEAELQRMQTDEPTPAA